MNLSSPQPTEKPKSDPKRDHDAWSGWGAIIGIAAGVVIGLFFHQAIAFGIVLGSIGWVTGALIDRSRS